MMKERARVSRRGLRPVLEGLEARLPLSTFTWTGGGGSANTNWSDSANWSGPAGSTVPGPHDDLVFPSGVTSLSPNNDLSANTIFNSISIGGAGYALTGNPISLTRNISTTYATGVSTFQIDTNLVGGAISVGSAGTLAFNAALSGSAGLTVSGGGTLDLLGANSYTGGTTISGPGTTLLVDSTTGSILNNGGVLGGNGTVGGVTSVGGTLSPGHSPLPGTFLTGSVSLDAQSSFAALLNGTSPGNGSTGYNQVVASGAVSLGGARLNATIGGGYVPAIGDQLTIIQNNSGSPISGFFSGLPEGGALSLDTNLFRITYQGGANHQDVVLTPVSRMTQTTIVGPTTSLTYGQTATFTATVTQTQGSPPPPLTTGTVDFYDGNPTSGGTLLGSAGLDSTGTAIDSFNRIPVTGASHQIYAVYVPDPSSTQFAGSTSSPALVTINPATLTVTGVTVQNKQYDTTRTASVDASSAVLSGVLSGDTVSLNSLNAVGAFATANVGVNIPVTVSGLSLTGPSATNYVLAQPTGLSAVISPAPLTLTADDLTMAQGGPVPPLTFHATGLLGSDTLSVLTTQPTLSTTATSASPAGTYPISIVGGSATNYTITDVPGTMTVVISTGTTTTLSASAQVAVAGEPVTFTALVRAVSSGLGTPTGSVAFIDNNTDLLGVVPLNAATGQATFTTSDLSFGSHSITAYYTGNTIFQSSTSSPAIVYVSSAGTQPALAIEAVRNRHGKLVAVDLVARVQPIAPAVGTPPGTVAFVVRGRARLVNLDEAGSAVYRLPAERALNQFVFVRYLGYFSLYQPSVSRNYLINIHNLGGLFSPAPHGHARPRVHPRAHVRAHEARGPRGPLHARKPAHAQRRDAVGHQAAVLGMGVLSGRQPAAGTSPHMA